MPLFAQALDNLSARPLGTGTKLALGDIAWNLLATLVLAAILFVGARYLRRSKRREHRSHRPAIVQNSIKSTGSRALQTTLDAEEEEADPGDLDGDAGASSSKHRKRRRRRGHRPRNPTLEETGGLPPSRTNDPVPPKA